MEDKNPKYKSEIKKSCTVVFLACIAVMVLETIPSCVCSDGCNCGRDRRHITGSFWPDIDLTLYETVRFSGFYMEDRAGLRFEDVRPSRPTDYWEIRFSNDNQASSSNIKIGVKCGTATDPERCRAEFDALRMERTVRHDIHLPLAHVLGNIFLTANVLANGVVVPYYSVLPFYIVSNHENENHLWDTREEILKFFGTIDAKEEAVLWIANDGFYGAAEKTDGAVRKVGDEYEFILDKTVTHEGNSYQINRYLVRVLPSGGVQTLREQLAVRSECKS